MSSGKNCVSRSEIKRSFMLTAAIATVFSVSAPIAIAQDEAADDFTGDTIVVTARNREESLQDVPLAITAFSQEDFKRRNIETLDDVARLTAGLSFEDFSGGFATPVIRGQTQTRITALESNVSTFLDGVYIPRAWAFDVGTANLNRIEVVKGPQSARYGRNAFAGAINYIPFKASLSDDPLSGQISGTVGSDERFDGGFRANLVLHERLAVAGSFNYSTFDGTFENAHPFADLLDLEQGTSGNIGGFEKNSFSASAIANPIDPLTVEVSFNRFNVENEARAGRNLQQFAGELNCGTEGFSFAFAGVFGGPRLFCGELPGPDEQAITDPRAFDIFAETDILRVGLNYEISDVLDFFYSFSTVNGDVVSAGASESDQINCGLFPFGGCAFTGSPNGAIDYVSHEARLVFDNDADWRFELGGFVSNGEDNFQTLTAFIPELELGVTDPATVEGALGLLEAAAPLGADLTETEIRAVFGAFEWRSPGERFKFAAEIRYSENDISGLDLTDPSAVALNETFSFFTPRVTAEYRVTDESLAYASVARGAKAGGFNPGATLPENLTFDEELNWTYELGVKNQFLDNRLVLNGAVFFTDWSNLQISSPDFGSPALLPANITTNLGGARVFGVEVESIFRATENLTFDGSFSYTDNRYRDGVFDQRFAAGAFNAGGLPPCDDIVCPSNGDIGGNRIERTPSTQISFGTEWEGDIPQLDNASYYIRGDLSWQNEFFASPINLATIPDRFLLGASAGVSVGPVDASVWVRNLTDESFVSNTFVTIISFNNSYNTFFGDRRSFGATVELNF